MAILIFVSLSALLPDCSGCNFVLFEFGSFNLGRLFHTTTKIGFIALSYMQLPKNSNVVVLHARKAMGTSVGA